MCCLLIAARKWHKAISLCVVYGYWICQGHLVSIKSLAVIFIYHNFYMEPNSFPIIRPAHADALQTRRAMRHRRLRSVRDRSQEQEVEKHHISPARLDLIRFKGKAFGIIIISYKLDFSIFKSMSDFFANRFRFLYGMDIFQFGTLDASGVLVFQNSLN